MHSVTLVKGNYFLLLEVLEMPHLFPLSEDHIVFFEVLPRGTLIVLAVRLELPPPTSSEELEEQI
jgi:hypothetical protein